jgi:hypothetical protein
MISRIDDRREDCKRRFNTNTVSDDVEHGWIMDCVKVLVRRRKEVVFARQRNDSSKASLCRDGLILKISSLLRLELVSMDLSECFFSTHVVPMPKLLFSP